MPDAKSAAETLGRRTAAAPSFTACDRVLASTMPIRPPSATRAVLALLCLMYFVTYVDRVNVSTARGHDFQQEFGLSKTQLGFVFSAFAYPYLVFQIIGGWLGDRFGRAARSWCAASSGRAPPSLTGFVHGWSDRSCCASCCSASARARPSRGDPAQCRTGPRRQRGFAQGITHSCARIGNAITPPGWSRGSIMTFSLARRPS